MPRVLGWGMCKNCCQSPHLVLWVPSSTLCTRPPGQSWCWYDHKLPSAGRRQKRLVALPLLCCLLSALTPPTGGRRDRQASGQASPCYGAFTAWLFPAHPSCLQHQAMIFTGEWLWDMGGEQIECGSRKAQGCGESLTPT